ncbi:Glycine N-acyltransferase [Armadillidium vulgare]|nr:Glycine N-acyltransferase [Armadillidium vulgare]
MDILQKAKFGDFSVIRTFLNKKLHASVSIIALLDIEEKFKFSRTIYISKDDPATFIFAKNIIDNWQSFNAFWDTNRVSDSKLKEYLSSVPNWSWKEKFSLCSADADLALKLDSVIVNGELSSVTLKRIFSGPYLVQKLTEDKLINRCLPKGYKYGVLKDYHLHYVFSKWNLGKNYSIENFQRYVKIFPTTAIFKNYDENYCYPKCWVFLNSHGYIGNIYTEPEYRRKGLASCALSYHCSKMMQKKLLIMSQIDEGNEASLEMHKKLGFETVSSVYWIHYDSND